MPQKVWRDGCFQKHQEALHRHAASVFGNLFDSDNDGGIQFSRDEKPGIYVHACTTPKGERHERTCVCLSRRCRGWYIYLRGARTPSHVQSRSCAGTHRCQLCITTALPPTILFLIRLHNKATHGRFHFCPAPFLFLTRGVVTNQGFENNKM